MTAGYNYTACACAEVHKPVEDRAWFVSFFKCNPNGEASRYSTVHCGQCGKKWRARSQLVDRLPRVSPSNAGHQPDTGAIP